jgi:hypothetical protein
VLWITCHCVPIASFQTYPFVLPMPGAPFVSGLDDVNARHRNAQVVPERLCRAGSIAALLLAPVAPALIKGGDLDFVRSGPMMH